jgi:hypothetical protein
MIVGSLDLSLELDRAFGKAENYQADRPDGFLDLLKSKVLL